MATYANTSYVAKDVGTSASSLVTVPSATTIAISSLVVSNTTLSPITTDVYFTRSAVDYYLVKGATIAVGGALEVIQGNRVVLIAADTLKVLNSAAASGDCVVSALTAV
jgi:hypothetical protein